MLGNRQVASPSRRGLLRAGAALGGGLLLEIALPARQPDAATQAYFAPNAFLRIARDGRATLIIPQAEMGQGVYTSMSMLIAEELDLDFAQVAVEHAPPDDARFTNPLLGFQVTGGSTSVRGFYQPLRRAGAAARAMLVQAAAAQWRISPAECRTEAGVVTDGRQRRLGYGALVDEAARLPVPESSVLRPIGQFRLIGTPAHRLDSAGKVDGSAAYGIDARPAGSLVATVAACPVFGGKLGSVDDAAARAIRGVRQVVRIENAVAVVAEHMGAARKGLEALSVTWNEGANATLSSAEMENALREASMRMGVVDKRQGDVAAAVAGAANVLEAEYQVPLLAHTTMEPLNCTVHVRPDGCEIWTGTQVISRAQQVAAEILGLPLEKVVVHNHFLGGGFGRRLEVDYVAQAVRIARQVQAPVKVVWTREEDIRHDIFRPWYLDRLTGALDASGKLIAFHHRVTGGSIVARWLPAAFQNGLDFDAVDGAAGPYTVPNLLVDWVRHDPPTGLVTGWWRGVGVTHNAFMVEGFIDELAAAAGQDPLAFRLALLDKAPRAAAVLRKAAQRAGWGSPLPARRARGLAVIEGFGTFMAQVAEVSVAEDGTVRVHRVTCAVDCGVVINPDTVRAQIEGGIMYGLTAVLYGQITVRDGRVEQSNFHDYQALRMNEAPAVDVHIIPSQEAPGGIGEPGTSTIAPAVVNAVFAVTGKRLRRLPIDITQLGSA